MRELSKDAQDVFDALIKMDDLSTACRDVISELDDTGSVDVDTFNKMRELVEIDG